MWLKSSTGHPSMGFLCSVLCSFFFNNFVFFTFRNVCLCSRILNNLLDRLLCADFLMCITHFYEVSKTNNFVFSIYNVTYLDTIKTYHFLYNIFNWCCCLSRGSHGQHLITFQINTAVVELFPLFWRTIGIGCCIKAAPHS